MKRNKWFILFIVVLMLPVIFNMIVFIIGCRRIDFHHFTKHDSLYFEIYDTLKSYPLETNNGIDWLIIKEKYVHEDYRKWILSEVEGRTFNASSYYEGIFIHNGFEEEFYVSYKKISDNADPLMRIIAANRYAMYIEDERNLIKPGIYKDTIIVDSTNSEQNFSEHFTFKYLKWHKYKGLIEYELSDGTVFKK